MADTSLLAVGERIAEMPFPTDRGRARWTSELVAGGPCVLVVLAGVSSPTSGPQARAFESLLPTFAGRGVSVVVLGPDDAGAMRRFRREARLEHLVLLADSTGQLCATLGALNGRGARRVAFVLDQHARVVEIIGGDAPAAQAQAALDVIDRRWPTPALVSA